ncbi:MAG TPA: Hsp33 family molecular chaperone HslO [Hyphomonadaceae bacterium]|jgi:molecular chaperone Hsp33|nr:Hsp33 family molecular chaperone HslO [Hyphomonadaceae bacterium]
MADKPMPNDPLGKSDDIVATFQIEDTSVRGRIARLGDGVLDPILKRHDYPRWAAHLLGEAITLAVLISASLKFDGKVLVQAQGEGPVSLLVAEARSDGGVRGYLRIDKDKWANLDRINKGQRPHIPQVIGRGVLAMLLQPNDPDQQPWQSLVPIEGATLADCAQMWFAQSEQIPTRVRLTVAEISERGGTRRWRSGGAMIQQVAGDAARGSTDEPWNNARHLFDTVTDLELADPDLPSGELLFRLFHESGVRLEVPRRLNDKCTCSEEKLLTTLRQMPKSEIVSLAEADGAVTADCQFCGRLYRFPTKDI